MYRKTAMRNKPCLPGSGDKALSHMNSTRSSHLRAVSTLSDMTCIRKKTDRYRSASFPFPHARKTGKLASIPELLLFLRRPFRVPRQYEKNCQDQLAVNRYSVTPARHSSVKRAGETLSDSTQVLSDPDGTSFNALRFMACDLSFVFIDKTSSR